MLFDLARASEAGAGSLRVWAFAAVCLRSSVSFKAPSIGNGKYQRSEEMVKRRSLSAGRQETACKGDVLTPIRAHRTAAASVCGVCLHWVEGVCVPYVDRWTIRTRRCRTTSPTTRTLRPCCSTVTQVLSSRSATSRATGEENFRQIVKQFMPFYKHGSEGVKYSYISLLLCL